MKLNRGLGPLEVRKPLADNLYVRECLMLALN